LYRTIETALAKGFITAFKNSVMCVMFLLISV
jgi:hypothetical protein